MAYQPGMQQGMQKVQLFGCIPHPHEISAILFFTSGMTLIAGAFVDWKSNKATVPAAPIWEWSDSTTSQQKAYFLMHGISFLLNLASLGWAYYERRHIISVTLFSEKDQYQVQQGPGRSEKGNFACIFFLICGLMLVGIWTMHLIVLKGFNSWTTLDKGLSITYTATGGLGVAFELFMMCDNSHGPQSQGYNQMAGGDPGMMGGGMGAMGDPGMMGGGGMAMPGGMGPGGF